MKSGPVDTPLTQGPLPKSFYTHQLEDITRKLLMGKDFEVRRSKKNNHRAYEKISDLDDPDIYDYDLIVDNTLYNLTEIVKYANLDHIELNDHDFNLYSDYLKSDKDAAHPEQRIAENEKTLRARLYNDYAQIPISPVLHLEEMQALNIYSQQNVYIKINAFLRRQWAYQSKAETKSIIIQSVMCASGLRKLPEVVIKDVYRGIELSPESPELQTYIHAAENNEVITLLGLVSTTTNKHHDFLNKNTTFHLTDLKGVYIAPLARGKSEEEFLIPPTQVQLTAYQLEGNKHQFTGRLVSDLSKIEPEALEMNNPQPLHTAFIPSEARLDLYGGGNEYMAKSVSKLQCKFLELPPSIIEVDARGNLLEFKTAEELKQLIDALPKTVTSIAFFDDFLPRDKLLNLIEARNNDTVNDAIAVFNQAQIVLKNTEKDKENAKTSVVNTEGNLQRKNAYLKELKPMTWLQKIIDFFIYGLNLFRTEPLNTYYKQYLDESTLRKQSVNDAIMDNENSHTRLAQAKKNNQDAVIEKKKAQQNLINIIKEVETSLKQDMNQQEESLTQESDPEPRKPEEPLVPSPTKNTGAESKQPNNHESASITTQPHFKEQFSSIKPDEHSEPIPPRNHWPR